MAVYADEDPFWAEFGKAKDGSDFLEKNYPRLPVALYCEVKNPLGLRGLPHHRARVCRTIGAADDHLGKPRLQWPGLCEDHRASQPVRVEGGVTNLCVYYAVTPNSLVLTLSEPVLKRALDRQHAQLAETSGQLQCRPGESLAGHKPLPPD